MNLGEFHDRVARALGRGSQLTSSIPYYVEEAVQKIEANYTFQYMKRWLELSIDSSADSPHVISIYALRVKRFDLLRYVGDDDRFHDLRKLNPADRQTRESGTPTGYWLDGVQSLILDTIPDEDLELEAHFSCFSSWQPGQPLFEHYLIDRHRALLLAATAMVAAIDLRDSRLYETYKVSFLDSQATVNVTEEDIQQGGETNSMEWYPPWDEFDPNFTRSS